LEIVRLHLARIDALNKIPVHGFVIKHPRAGAILVDTGVGWPTELVKEWKVVNRHAAEALEEHDLSPADVRIVVNTHLHFDHCGQNAVFKHAPFYIQRTELDRARRENDITNQWFDFAGARFELLDGDAEVAEGVRVVATPGHTSGHQSVVIDTPDGGAVMIGDAA
jgi:N-acyl homoserine lactone hydrolase